MRIKSLSWVVLGLMVSVEAFALPPALEEVVESARKYASWGVTPVVITDLDETVIDSSARRYYSLRAAAAQMCGAARSGACGRGAGLNLGELKAQPNAYDLRALLARAGVGPGAWREALLARADEIYLSGARLELDQAVPGAAELIAALHGAGAEVFFVSARWSRTQLEGTIRNLEDLGMLEPGTGRDRVILRPDGQGSLEFKKEAFARVRAWAERRDGLVDLVMENEPENMNALTTEFPSATAVFVEGAWLKQEPLRDVPTLRVRSFR